VTHFVNGAIEFHVPVTVHNSGYLSVEGVFVAVNVSDRGGERIIAGKSPTFGVSPQSSVGVNITLTANLKSVPNDQMLELLTSDQNLTLSAILKASLPPLVDLSGTIAGHLPWGALMKNLTVGPPTFSPVNSTFSKIVWPFGFVDSNQYFHLSANVTGMVSDSGGRFLGRLVSTPVDVRRGSAFRGTLSLIVPILDLPAPGGEPLKALLVVSDNALFTAEIEVTLPG
jgi:hypothetical protein